VQAATLLPPSTDSLTASFAGWICGVAFVYAALFGVGSLLYGRTMQGAVWLAIFLLSGVALLKLVPKLWGSSARS
jgi:hypothetical protein